MLAVPKLTPLTVGCVAGVVAPAMIKTEAGWIVAIPVLLLLRFTVRPFAGAAGEMLILKAADWPGPTATFSGTLMLPGAATVTMTLAGVTFGAIELAEMVAAPAAMADTCTLAVVPFAAKLTVAGTMATLVFEEPRFTVKPPAGAGADRVSVKFCIVPAPMAIGPAGKLSAAPTKTC